MGRMNKDEDERQNGKIELGLGGFLFSRFELGLV
jgi:hypothetical protein